MYVRTLKKVFKNPGYVIFAGGVSILALAGIIWFPNNALIVQVLSDGGVPLQEKIFLMTNLLVGATTSITPFTLIYTSIATTLFGVYSALAVYMVRRESGRGLLGGTTTSLLGMVSGVLGIGCAACGSLVFLSVLGAIGLSGIIAAIPLAGTLFGLLSVLLLAVAVMTLLQKIAAPKVCSTKM